MRILVASYLMAASVGIAPGPDLVPILEQFMPRTSATVLGTAVLFLLAYAMMAGMWLRITILLLAIILVGTSYMENFILAATPDLGTMWQEVVVLCALMQTHPPDQSPAPQSAIVRRKNPCAVSRRATRLSACAQTISRNRFRVCRCPPRQSRNPSKPTSGTRRDRQYLCLNAALKAHKSHRTSLRDRSGAAQVKASCRWHRRWSGPVF